ncbi:MAG: cytochrome c [Pirellulaceae bacterium]|nr:cytochrome c [Pirellulaceae bacterium]
MSGKALLFLKRLTSRLTNRLTNLLTWGATLGGAIALSGLVGCEVPVATFQPNKLQATVLGEKNSIDMSPATAEVSAALEELFGTPDDPRWPAALMEEEHLAKLVDMERLQRAAGAVRSDEQDQHFGLYREHCVHCHGTSGNGLGPTATFLNPYPRDFRLGVFKFKSTPFGRKPTRTDLTRLLKEGIMGTSMPSFRLLKDDELESLVDYVIYLSARGEVERKLLASSTELDFTDGDHLYDPSIKEKDPDEFEAQMEVINEIVIGVAESWDKATDQAITVAAPPEDYPLFTRDVGGSPEVYGKLEESIASGRKIFHGNVANCATCHGNTALGDGQKNDYDIWTKDWLQALNLDPKNREQISPYLKLGALKPRNIVPRNLRSGMYRGGSQPVDIYMRIVLGIDGTTMPAAAMKPQNPLGLSENEVWDVVNYVLSLPYEHLSNSAASVPPFAREKP